MADPIKPPLRPCGSCPYRRDVPSGVWEAEEYERLPAFDNPHDPDAYGVFMCHQQNGHVCGGWAGCHDMEEAIGPRIALSMGSMDGAAYEALLDYETDVPLFESGAATAEHGLAQVTDPDTDAQRVIDRLVRKERRRSGREPESANNLPEQTQKGGEVGTSS